MKKINKKPTTEQQKLALGMSEQNFKIYLRIKPAQTPDSNYQILKIACQNKVEIVSPYYTVNEIQKVYTYEEVFDDTVNNCRIFQQTMINPISNVLQGFNSTVFIYGMTGSGKTYTMFGTTGNGTSKHLRGQQDGLVSMTIDYLFNQIHKQSHIKSQIIVSFYQIYNQNIRDLLQQQQYSLTIMQDPIRGVFINGLCQVVAEQKNQIKDIITSGIQRRAMNATRSNQVSSRSHAVLQFIVKRYVNINQNQTTVLQSKFFMIDLAGNEKTSNNQSRRFIQGVNINKSLLTLGKCLSILAERKSAYVPFRDSKLTRILKQSLGGNSKTVMIACVSSERKFYEQTLNTLKYSSIAKRIKNKGIKNNIKMISKQQMPDFRNFVNAKSQIQNGVQVQIRLKKLLQSFLKSVQIKLSIERLQQDLQTSKKQNEQLLRYQEGDPQVCKYNIKRINDTIQQLIRPYEKHLQKLDLSYQQLIDTISQMIKQGRQRMSNKQNNMNACNQEQIVNLKKQISVQNSKIQQLQQRLYSQSIGYVQSQYSNTENFNKSLDNRRQLKIINNNTLNSPTIQKQNNLVSLNNIVHVAKQVQPSRSLSKGKKLTLNFIESEETLRSSGLNNIASSNRSQCPLGEKKNSGTFNKLQKQIVINLNNQKIEKKTYNNKDQFVKRLKQTQKRAKGLQNQQICSLLKQQEVHRYELGNAQMSMIRKLKFFQRQKSLEKSNSLSKLGNKNQQMLKYVGRKY